MTETMKFPFYAKLAFTLLSLISILALLYFGRGIILPVLMAFLFAILLRPVAEFFRAKLRFPHVIASIMAVLLFVVLVIGVFTFITWQISDIANDWGKIKTNFSIHLANFQDMIRHNFNLSNREQDKLIDDATKDSMQSGKEIVGSTLMSVTDMLINLTLIPIYIFLILLYRTHFIKFFAKLFKKEHHEVLKDILCRIKISVQSYIVGLLIETVTVAILTAAGFMAIGLEYAILLGVITGILNLIPYIGILFAGVLSIIASLTTTPDLTIVVGIIIVNIIVQIVDNNILVPLIVSSKVEINAFVSIIGIIVGGALGGISGMFLAIPILAILKVIFDRIEPLEPWGYLMGDDLPKTFVWRKIKLPLFNYENSTGSGLNSESTTSIFTETTTDPNQE